MKSRLSKLLVALLLVVAIASTSLFFASCGKNGDDTTGGGASIEKPTDSTPGGTPDEPPVDEVTVVDRTAYTMDKIVNSYLSMPLYDVATGNFATTPEILDGYTLGDVMNQALLVAEEALKVQLMGISLSAFGYYYCTDGNWYDNATKMPVNDLLNKILNYKLDGSEPLDINLKVYGSKTLAYIMFDYVEPDLSSGNATFDKNTIVYSLMQSSPILDATLNMNMSQLSTLLDGDMTQKIFTAVEVFGPLTVGDITDLFGIYTDDAAASSKLVATILDVSVADVCGVLVAQDPEVQAQKIATILGDLTIQDCLMIDDTLAQSSCFKPLFETKIGYLLVAEANGDGFAIILSKIGTVTMGQIVSEVAAGRVDPAVLAGYLETYKTAASITINDIVLAATSEAGRNKITEILYSYVKDVILTETITVDNLVNAVAPYVDKYYPVYVETGDLAGALMAALTEAYETNVQTIDQWLVEKTDMTSEQAMALVQKYVIADETTGEIKDYDYYGLANELYTTYQAQIDEALVTYTGMTSQQLIALVQKYAIADETTGEMIGYDIDGLANEIYAAYKTQIDEFILINTGMTVEEILTLVGQYMIVDAETGETIGWDYDKIYAEVNAILAAYNCPLSVEEIIELADRYTEVGEDGKIAVNSTALVADLNALLASMGYEITVEEIEAFINGYLTVDQETGETVIDREKLMTDLNMWLYQNAGGLTTDDIIARFDFHKIYDEEGNLIGYDVAGLASDIIGVIVYLNADMPIAHFTLGDLAAMVMAYTAGDYEDFDASLKIVCGDLTVGDVVIYAMDAIDLLVEAIYYVDGPVNDYAPAA